MKTESSSRDTDVDRLIKGFLTPGEERAPEKEEKFVSRRKIMFPKELFIELKLKKNDVLKVKQWEKDGHTVWFPMWFSSLERVLFIPEDLWAEYCRKKGMAP